MNLDLSDERRATALRWIQGERLLDAPIDYPTRLTAVVGLLICDDAGHIKQADLLEALNDPSVVQIARTLLREARR